jgi:hypothetical protein
MAQTPCGSPYDNISKISKSFPYPMSTHSSEHWKTLGLFVEDKDEGSSIFGCTDAHMALITFVMEQLRYIDPYNELIGNVRSQYVYEQILTSVNVTE